MKHFTKTLMSIVALAALLCVASPAAAAVDLSIPDLRLTGLQATFVGNEGDTAIITPGDISVTIPASGHITVVLTEGPGIYWINGANPFYFAGPILRQWIDKAKDGEPRPYLKLISTSSQGDFWAGLGFKAAESLDGVDFGSLKRLAVFGFFDPNGNVILRFSTDGQFNAEAKPGYETHIPTGAGFWFDDGSLDGSDVIGIRQFNLDTPYFANRGITPDALVYSGVVFIDPVTERQVGSFWLNMSESGPASDTDGDGLPDFWEISFFKGQLNQGPNDDPDLDGYTNMEEFVAKTDPTITADTPAGTLPAGYVVTPTVTTVQSSGDLVSVVINHNGVPINSNQVYWTRTFDESNIYGPFDITNGVAETSWTGPTGFWNFFIGPDINNLTPIGAVTVNGPAAITHNYSVTSSGTVNADGKVEFLVKDGSSPVLTNVRVVRSYDSSNPLGPWDNTQGMYDVEWASGDGSFDVFVGTELVGTVQVDVPTAPAAITVAFDSTSVAQGAKVWFTVKQGTALITNGVEVIRSFDSANTWGPWGRADGRYNTDWTSASSGTLKVLVNGVIVKTQTITVTGTSTVTTAGSVNYIGAVNGVYTATAGQSYTFDCVFTDDSNNPVDSGVTYEFRVPGVSWGKFAGPYDNSTGEYNVEVDWSDPIDMEVRLVDNGVPSPGVIVRFE